ncbi:hypothetical protein J6590_091459 [Homalodisca vitripennis]|nr:hypothetical protein J6590_091459 [Homalodisca vitripennis]
MKICRPVFKRLQLLTLLSLYILEPTSYGVLKCTLTNGRDVHSYETKGRENYRTRRHRMVVHERLPSQAVHLIGSLPNEILNSPTHKAFKSRLKRCLVPNAFYSVNEFKAYNWETSN